MNPKILVLAVVVLAFASLAVGLCNTVLRRQVPQGSCFLAIGIALVSIGVFRLSDPPLGLLVALVIGCLVELALKLRALFKGAQKGEAA